MNLPSQGVKVWNEQKIKIVGACSGSLEGQILEILVQFMAFVWNTGFS